MGVPSLFREVVTKHKDVHFWKNDFKVDYFFWDFNGIIYEMAAKMEMPYNSANNSKFEDKLIKLIIEETKNMITKISPNKMVYIAIDGPAPKAKMIQQRWRRYKAIKFDRYKNEVYNKYNLKYQKGWDTRKISPGTNFMWKLNNFMRNSIQSNKIYNKTGAKFIFSSSNVPGEAEHKFLDIIRNNDFTDADNIVIYSKDGDLIPLSLGLQKKNVYVLRPVGSDETYLNYDVSKMCYLSMDKYREAHIQEMGFNDVNNNNTNRLIYDYIFLLSLGGNDFVQPINFLRIKDKGLPKILRAYQEIRVHHHDYLVSINNNEIQINSQFLKNLMFKFAGSEEFYLKKMRLSFDGKKNRGLNDRQIAQEMDKEPYEIELSRFEHMEVFMEEHPLHHEFKNDFYKLDFKKPMSEWRNKYYEMVFGLKTDDSNYDSQINTICHNYLLSLAFTINYYIIGVPSWSYFYPYIAAPLATDFSKYLSSLENINDVIKFNLDKPYKPFEQLMMIYPPELKQLLPTQLRKLMTNSTSSTIQYYPVDFEMDYIIGRKYIYSEPKLPIIDDNVLIPEIKKLEKTFDDKENERNQLILQPEEFLL